MMNQSNFFSIEVTIEFINKTKNEVKYNFSKKYIESLEPDNMFLRTKNVNNESTEILIIKDINNKQKLHIKSNKITTFISTIDDLLVNAVVLENLSSSIVLQL